MNFVKSIYYRSSRRILSIEYFLFFFYFLVSQIDMNFKILLVFDMKKYILEGDIFYKNIWLSEIHLLWNKENLILMMNLRMII